MTFSNDRAFYCQFRLLWHENELKGDVYVALGRDNDLCTRDLSRYTGVAPHRAVKSQAMMAINDPSLQPSLLKLTTRLPNREADVPTAIDLVGMLMVRDPGGRSQSYQWR